MDVICEHIPSAQLHFFDSWRWAPGQPGVFPGPDPEKEPETSPWGCVAARLKTWPCLLCSCWPTTCFADKSVLQPHSVVGLPHWDSLWWVSLKEIESFDLMLFVALKCFTYLAPITLFNAALKCSLTSGGSNAVSPHANNFVSPDQFTMTRYS